MRHAHQQRSFCGAAALGASLVYLAACGGGGSGSGDVTGPPGGNAAEVDSIVLNFDSTDVEVGDTVRLVALPTDANGNVVPAVQLSWTSSDPSVATVSPDGLVTAVDLGEAEIGVDVAGASASQSRSDNITMSLMATDQNRGKGKAKIKTRPRVVIAPGDQNAQVNQTVSYSVKVSDAKGRDLPNWTKTEWSSFDPSVATIDPASGVATARAAGETQIIVTVTVKQKQYQSTVILRVIACGGALEIEEWDATLNLSWAQTGSHLEERFNVYQRSSATAHLTRLVHDATHSRWFADLTGTGRIENRSSHPDNRLPGGVYLLAEDGNGPLQSIARTGLILEIIATSPETCNFVLTYTERMTWTMSDNNGFRRQDTGSFGQATVAGTLGPKPSGGWVFGETKELPVQELSLGTATSAYMPATGVGVALLTSADGGAGTASFSYSLTAAAPH